MSKAILGTTRQQESGGKETEYMRTKSSLPDPDHQREIRHVKYERGAERQAARHPL